MYTKKYSDQNTQILHGAISSLVSMVNNELYIMHVFWKCFWNEYFICEYIFFYKRNAEQKRNMWFESGVCDFVSKVI